MKKVLEAGELDVNDKKCVSESSGGEDQSEDENEDEANDQESSDDSSEGEERKTVKEQKPTN